jgi:hypothetical protein
MVNDRELVLMHIEKYGSITQGEADDLYGIKRLSARINELRNMGHPIKTDMISCKNRRGRISNFAKYSLEEVGQ